MHRARIGAFLLLGIAAVLVLIPASRKDPAYHGRRLSRWLLDLRDPAPLSQFQAQEAVRDIGTNALPLLKERLHAEDSSFKTNVINLLRKQSWIKISIVPARERRIQAALACVVLGPNAKAAIPELLEFSKGDSFCANLAESAWARIGEPAAQPLSLLLTTNDFVMRRLAAAALADMGPQAASVLPALIASVQDRNSGVRDLAATALYRSGIASPEVVRVFLESLEDEEIEVRQMASLALNDPKKKTVPALLLLTNDPDPTIRNRANHALQTLGEDSKTQPR